MTDEAPQRPSPWQRPSLTTAGKDCVEIRVCGDGHVEVRNARFPDDGFLAFTRSAWAAFITSVIAGEFDVLDGQRMEKHLTAGVADGSVKAYPARRYFSPYFI